MATGGGDGRQLLCRQEDILQCHCKTDKRIECSVMHNRQRMCVCVCACQCVPCGAVRAAGSGW